MIRASLCIDPRRPFIVAEGHSGYAPWGQDIVCAMVSITMQALDYRLRELGNGVDGSVIDEDAGYMMVCWEPVKERDTREDWKALEAFAFAEDALRLVADCYPEHLQITAHAQK